MLWCTGHRVGVLEMLPLLWLIRDVDYVVSEGSECGQ